MRVYYKLDKNSFLWAAIAVVGGRSLLLDNSLENENPGHSFRGNEFHLDQLLIDNEYLAAAVCIIGVLLIFVRVDLQRENQG